MPQVRAQRRVIHIFLPRKDGFYNLKIPILGASGILLPQKEPFLPSFSQLFNLKNFQIYSVYIHEFYMDSPVIIIFQYRVFSLFFCTVDS
jgi:hypothetical protein